MANATLPTTVGIADWENNNHTWREEDAEYLQNRSIIRVADATAAGALTTPYSIGVGSTVHLANENTIASYDGTNWRRAFMSRHAETTDSASAVKLHHRDASNGVSLNSDGSVSMGGSVEVTGSVTSGSLNTPTLNMSSSSITSSGNNITVAAGAGGTFAVNKAATFGSTLGVTGVTTLGTANITNATVSGTLTSSTTFNGATGSFSTSLSSPTVVVGTNVTVSGTGLFRSGSDSYGVIIGANGPTLKGNGSGQVKLQQVGRTETAGVAGWVESVNPPNLEDFPDGTIWFEV